MREFFGIGGYERTPEGYLSWQHLLFVTLLLAVMTAAAVILGRRNRGRDMKTAVLPLAVTGILIDVLELSMIVFRCFREGNPWQWLYSLPLFLCSIPLFAIPMAAFTRGRLQEASLDFVAIFGILAAVMGTYGAGNNYGSYPVLGIDNVHSGITHAIAGFASLYILIAGLASMKRKNIWISFSIITVFCGLAYVADILIPYNYMFLMRGDGTPYDIVFDLTGGNPVLYPLTVLLMFFAYIAVYYLIFYLTAGKRRAKAAEKSAD